MKRPPGLWILLSAGFLWLSLDDVDGIRATALIFGKTSTTTAKTTTTEQTDDEGITTEPNGDGNSTKPLLTGNPQLDYVWDPNLPKELNGYNLSDYPFYERVPEDIDFKCDGLHDGFYASVKHKCQVYHHCLFGTRYDFLCANYTAFDQKTFICHFASEVDCVNSKKFWHRNDALYISATTTSTAKPFNIYTPPPQSAPITPLAPAAGAAPVAVPGAVPLEPTSVGARRPYMGQRRPLRRRPQYDYYDEEYYDDYYEDRPRSNRGRKRPRPRPRPYYEDEYDDEYEDDRYERRGSGGRRNEKRRPYDRKSNNRRRNKDRTRIEYDEDERFQDDDSKMSSRRKNNDRTRESDYVDDSYERNYGRRHNSNDYNKRNRKPSESEEDRSLENDKRQKKKDNPRETTSSKPRPIIKTVSGTIYDKPRVAPKIKLPVPKNEAEKYAYKPITKSEHNSKESHEYEEEYEEDIDDSKKVVSNSKQHHGVSKQGPINFKRPLKQSDSYESYEVSQEKDKNKQVKPSVEEEYYDEYDEEMEEEFSKKTKNVQKINPPSTTSTTTTKPKTTSTPSTRTTTRSTTTSTEINIIRVKEPLIRLVKRPFLPSRGGNPYTQRGLQPVGARALNKNPEETSEEYDSRENHEEQKGNLKNYDRENMQIPIQTIFHQQPVFKPSPMIINTSSVGITFPSSQNFQPIMKTTLNYQERTTHPPKLPDKNTLEINEDEYDVTLNDALNPTLPNLPVRGYPSGFSTKDYAYNNFQMGAFNADQDKAPTRYEYVYESKPPNQRYQLVPQTDVREPFVHSSADFKGQFSVINENYHPLPVQNTQVFFRRY